MEKGKTKDNDDEDDDDDNDDDDDKEASMRKTNVVDNDHEKTAICLPRQLICLSILRQKAT